MSIKDFPVRVKIKNKTRGRPSKVELLMSKIVSHNFMKPKFQKLLADKMSDDILYGSCFISDEEIQEALK